MNSGLDRGGERVAVSPKPDLLGENRPVSKAPGTLGEDKVPLCPGRVVANVLGEEDLDEGELLVPLVGAEDDPLPVGPGMVVLGILLKEGSDKGQVLLGLGSILRGEQEGDDGLAVVPDLVVLGVGLGHVGHEEELLLVDVGKGGE